MLVFTTILKRKFVYDFSYNGRNWLTGTMTDRGECIGLLPVRLWGLNPLFWTHMKMFVKRILSLQEHPDYKGIFKNERLFSLSRNELTILWKDLTFLWNDLTLLGNALIFCFLERSDYIVERSDYIVERSDFLVERSDFIVERSDFFCWTIWLYCGTIWIFCGTIWLYCGAIWVGTIWPDTFTCREEDPSTKKILEKIHEFQFLFLLRGILLF